METKKTKKTTASAAAPKKSAPAKVVTPKVTAPVVTESAAKVAPVKAESVKVVAPKVVAPKETTPVVTTSAKVEAVKAESVKVVAPKEVAPVKRTVEKSSGVLHEQVAKVAPKSSAKQPLAHGVGRRKSSVARVWLRRGTGLIVVNGLSHIEYFDTDIMRADAARPFAVVPMASRYDVMANVKGGGLVAQAGAVRLGISRALLILDENVRIVLRQNGLLTCDSRVKERKKYGQKAARRKFQFVKR
jgi:small subunit ribosomal protein S9